MSFKFGSTSVKRLDTCHPDLIKVMELAIQLTPVDFGIAVGHRTVAEQQALYAQGRSTPGNIVTHIDGITKKSKHNHKPSRAVDVYAFVNGKASWDNNHLLVIAGVVIAAGNILGIKLRWGGNWDQDGEVVTDQTFQDFPHFELV